LRGVSRIGWLCAQRPAGGQGWRRRGAAWLMIGRRRAGRQTSIVTCGPGNAEYTQAHAARAWVAEEITWGILTSPETRPGSWAMGGPRRHRAGLRHRLLPAWLARRGAGRSVDITPASCAPRESAAPDRITFPPHRGRRHPTSLPAARFDAGYSDAGRAWV